MAKVIIIGDSGVGKTSLITRFCENAFKHSYMATIVMDFQIKAILVNNRKFRLQIWDPAGQERFKVITQTFYKGAAGIILAYSTTDRASFQNIERWITQLDNNAPAEASRVLLATKDDL
jgi:Ras-related protein Rab-8A